MNFQFKLAYYTIASQIIKTQSYADSEWFINISITHTRIQLINFLSHTWLIKIASWSWLSNKYLQLKLIYLIIRISNTKDW